MPELNTETAPVSFETALTQLQEIVSDLEEGDLGLEPSLARFEEGIRLLRNCYQILEQAEQKIEILTGQDATGNPVAVPFDGTATFEGTEKPAARKPGRRRTATKADGANDPAAPQDVGRDEVSLF